MLGSGVILIIRAMVGRVRLSGQGGFLVLVVFLDPRDVRDRSADRVEHLDDAVVLEVAEHPDSGQNR